MRNITLAILLILGVTVLANADTIVDRTPDDDAKLYQRSGDKNYGADRIACSDWDGYVLWGDNETTHCMIEFDISDVLATVNSATLDLYSTIADRDVHAVLGTDDNVDEDWDQDTVTWNNTSGGSIDTNVTSASITTGTGYGSILTVTSIIQAAVTAGQDAVTIYITCDDDEVKADFYSSETATRTPLLGIEHVPEPATMGLLLLGGLGVLARKRR